MVVVVTVVVDDDDDVVVDVDVDALVADDDHATTDLAYALEADSTGFIVH